MGSALHVHIVFLSTNNLFRTVLLCALWRLGGNAVPAPRLREGNLSNVTHLGSNLNSDLAGSESHGFLCGLSSSNALGTSDSITEMPGDFSRGGDVWVVTGPISDDTAIVNEHSHQEPCPLSHLSYLHVLRAPATCHMPGITVGTGCRVPGGGGKVCSPLL